MWLGPASLEHGVSGGAGSPADSPDSPKGFGLGYKAQRWHDLHVVEERESERERERERERDRDRDRGSERERGRDLP